MGANQAMDSWFPLNSDDASLMRVHVYWPSNQDPMYTAIPEQNEYLREMQPELINSVPWLYLDNEYSVPATHNSDWPIFIEDGYAQRRLFVGSPLEVGVAFAPADSTARITLDIIDPMAAGKHEMPWNGLDATGRSVSSGVYFARLDTGGHVVLGRMTLIR